MRKQKTLLKEITEIKKAINNGTAETDYISYLARLVSLYWETESEKLESKITDIVYALNKKCETHQPEIFRTYLIFLGINDPDSFHLIGGHNYDLDFNEGYDLYGHFELVEDNLQIKAGSVIKVQ